MAPPEFVPDTVTWLPSVMSRRLPAISRCTCVPADVVTVTEPEGTLIVSVPPVTAVRIPPTALTPEHPVAVSMAAEGAEPPCSAWWPAEPSAALAA